VLEGIEENKKFTIISFPSQFPIDFRYISLIELRTKVFVTIKPRQVPRMPKRNRISRKNSTAFANYATAHKRRPSASHNKSEWMKAKEKRRQTVYGDCK